MTVIELRDGGRVRTTEKVRNTRYIHAYIADILAYARCFGLTPGVNCEVVVTSDIRKEERKLIEMIGA